MNTWEAKVREQGTVAAGIVPALHTAVVYALDGVRFVAAAPSRRTLIGHLADYVRRCAADSLWASDARHVDDLLARGAHEDAVDLYFAVVGQRWDEEWIVLADPTAS